LRIHSITLCDIRLLRIVSTDFVALRLFCFNMRQHGRQILYFKLHVDGRKFYYRRPQVVHRWSGPVFPYLFLASAPFSDKQISISLLSVACRGLVMPGATAWLYFPLTNASAEQWRMVVFGTGHTLFVTSQHDVIFLFANQRFGEVCW